MPYFFHIENLTNKQKIFGHQAFNEHNADYLDISCIFEILNKKQWVTDVNFEI